jgi:hypothetical protein
MTQKLKTTSMTHDTPKSKRPARKVRPLAIAALLAGSIFQPLLPALGAGTLAGTSISNTATATYDDDTDPGTTPDINATSNTVTITVAEVAGLTATPAGFNDLDGGAVEAGDTLEFIFDVTNVGNAATNIHVPAIGNLTSQNFTPSQVLVSTDGGASYALLSTFPDDIVPNVNPDQVIKVKVVGTPAAGTLAGNPVGVTLGNTGPNNNSASTQNQPDAADTALANDLRTVDPTPATTDDPVNGEREASATQSIPFASSVRPLALATVTKIASNLAPGPTGNANDDLITYDLGLTVENTSPNAAFTPADLEGTPINVDGSSVQRILVSDAIPVGTQLSSVGTLPPNWQVVYTTTTTTTAAVNASWTTTPPGGGLSAATRIGFIYTGGTTLARNTTVSPFRFTVETNGVPATGGQVANIAQAFGETVGDATNEVVYDESGDSQPNNFNDNQTPPDNTGTNFNPATDTGVANPVTQGTDTGNNNTGQGPAGENNVVNLGAAAGSDDILNGPNGAPAATGPNSDNDDFTNKSTTVPAGVGPTGTFNPDAVTFTNTVSNPAGSGFISNVTLQPISPTQADAADNSALTGLYGTNADIPTGTTVTITYDPTSGSPGPDIRTATYTFNGTIFTLSSSTTGGTADGTATPINIGDLSAGSTVSYSVTVDLPAGVSPLDEIPIPIIAFPDDDPTGTPGYTGETTNNITIDRLYTGFMQLTKEAQILNASGQVVQAWTSNQATLTAVEVRPDYLIEYRITYNNISTPVSGSGSVGLTAFEFKVVEDGNAGTNNWATSTSHQQNTSAAQGTINYFTNSADAAPLTTSDPASGTKVDKYENVVGQVDPTQSGQFQFRRRIR